MTLTALTSLLRITITLSPELPSHPSPETWLHLTVNASFHSFSLALKTTIYFLALTFPHTSEMWAIQYLSFKFVSICI